MPRFVFCHKIKKIMNTELLELAKRRVPNTSVLLNMVSKRARQLIAGNRPMIKVANQHADLEDIVLQEIAEGKLMAEIDLASQ
jgi:DNA-directed RNA polymerase subunit omega